MLRHYIAGLWQDLLFQDVSFCRANSQQYLYICVHMYVYVCTHVGVWVCACIFNKYMYTYLYLYTYICIYIYTSIHISIYIYTCVHICIYTYICIYISVWILLLWVICFLHKIKHIDTHMCILYLFTVMFKIWRFECVFLQCVRVCERILISICK